jgi:hypothetical protein
MRLPPFIVAIVLVVVFAGVGPAQASHSWNGYHWSRSSNPFTIQLGDNVNSTWDSYLQAACSQWSVTSGACNNSSNPVRCVVIPGSSSSRNCRPADGHVEVCNARYGNNGWLGIAGIWVNGDHITRGYVKVNDYYFDTPTYNTPDWRQQVMSQEVGHIFGLTHQDENFNNADLLDACGRGTCMDYSSDPTNQTTPNQHDYDELVIIYSHLDGAANLMAGFPADEGVDLENPSTWGQATRFDDKGRGIVYERILPNGNKLVNFVLWAE